MLRNELCLRTALASCRAQSTFCTASTYHTAAQTPRRSQDGKQSRRRVPLVKTTPSLTSSLFSQVRYNSSTSSTPNKVAPASTSSQDQLLDWNTYFKLRKNRRRLQLAGSVGTSLTTMLGGAQVLAISDMDSIVGQIPLDPFITLGLITFGCGGAGWLLGPIVGTGIFNMLNGKHRVQMAAKEKQFYERIKQFRVDPSNSSMANPVPDYYGERISSVQGYRQWLKDQRAFNKKRQTFV